MLGSGHVEPEIIAHCNPHLLNLIVSAYERNPQFEGGRLNYQGLLFRPTMDAWFAKAGSEAS